MGGNCTNCSTCKGQEQTEELQQEYVKWTTNTQVRKGEYVREYQLKDSFSSNTTHNQTPAPSYTVRTA